jgi:hypothetical protein
VRGGREVGEVGRVYARVGELLAHPKLRERFKRESGALVGMFLGFKYESKPRQDKDKD